ncbi:hypothetical protein YT1_1776 [Rhodococcus ruber]|nr:hypothetical protein YT1_1776 [Rhodococcus ruber]
MSRSTTQRAAREACGRRACGRRRPPGRSRRPRPRCGRSIRRP